MKLMILDGNSIINRAFYGVGYLSSQSGQPPGRVTVSSNIMQSLLDEESQKLWQWPLTKKAPPSATPPMPLQGHPKAHAA